MEKGDATIIYSGAAQLGHAFHPIESVTVQSCSMATSAKVSVSFWDTDFRSFSVKVRKYENVKLCLLYWAFFTFFV